MPVPLPCFHLRMPAAHHFTSPASSILLKLLSVPIFFVLPTTMPPFPRFPVLQRTGATMLNFKYDQLAVAFAVVLAIAAVIRIVVVYLAQRKSETLDVNPDISEKPTFRPSLDREDSAVCQKHWEIDHNERLNSLKQEIFQHTEKPIYPWISPPQALPGPYDPMYFPLPAPTIRKTSLVSSPAKREGRHSASYTRLVPDCGTPPRSTVLYGTMTTSTNGWRRTHWNVTGG